jgi:hypothetical protein
MSHVDEGRIHAYLDQQLEFAGLDARQEFEAHIAQCAECATLVERARASHTTAAALLQRSEPIDVALPPFDVVTARARRGVGFAETRRIVRLRGLAWAASIVVAVGVGWYAQLSLGSGGAGEQTLSDSAATLRMVALTREADSIGPAPATEERSEVPPLAGPSTVASLDETDVDAPATSTVAVAREPEPVDRAVVALAERGRADRTVAERARSGAMAGQESQRSEVTSQDRVERERRRVVDEIAPAQARLAVREAASAGVDQPTLVLDSRAAAVTEWLEVDRSTAERTLGAAVLAVDGLPLVGFSVPASGLPIVRVKQILPSGDSLEILQQRANTAGNTPTPPNEGVSRVAGFAARGATSGETTVTTSVGELVVTGRAAIEPDSLRTLLGRLREASRLN